MEMYWPLCPFSISTESGFSRAWAKSASLDAWNWGRKARTLESTGWAGKMGQSHDLLAANSEADQLTITFRDNMRPAW